MKRIICPYCQAQLNLNKHLVLAGKCTSNVGIFLLSEELGDYTMYHSDNLMLKEGDRVHFMCPACHHTLEYKENNNLARVIQIDEDGSEHAVIFSAVFGEQSTYKVNEVRTLTFGEHAVRYMDPDWYRKL